MRLARVTLAVLVVAAPGSALAQENFVPRDLARGITTPTGVGTAGDYDATAINTNPAGLATIAGASVAFAATVLASESTVVGGGGWGLFIGLPLITLDVGDEELRAGYGFGFQSVDAPDSWVGVIPGSQDAVVFSNSTFFGTDRWSLGWSFNTVRWNDTPQDGSTVFTHNIGLALRPFRHLAVGTQIRDVFEPVARVPEERLDRSYEVDAMIRPLGDWRLEVGGGAAFGDDELIDIRGKAFVRLIPGVELFGQYESIERVFAPATTATSRDNRVMVGLTISGIDALLGKNQPAFGASYATLLSTESPSSYAGSSAMVSLSAERRPAIIAHKRIEQIELDSAATDRAFLRSLAYLHSLESSRGLYGVVLSLGASPWGWGRAEELRAAIERLRKRGKRVVAYIAAGDMRSYYVASAAERIVIHPTASLSLTGVGGRSVHFKSMLDKIGVKAQVIQFEDYKSAGEIFSRTSPSKEAREQLEELWADVTDELVTRVADDRGLEASKVRSFLERTSISPPDAVAEKLVDAIAFEDELDDQVESLLGESIDVARPSNRREHPTSWAFPTIAVIHIDGAIEPGKRAGFFGTEPGGETIARAIKSARESSRIDGIILRINSPGGAVLPSEQIARQVELTRGKKPIVASMADVAASGGYMVAAHADRIYAEPSTITGSIGIISVKLSAARLLQRMGVTSEPIQTGDHVDADTLFRPWTDDEIAAQTQTMAYLYDRFVSLVATGRSLPKDSVLQVARGRVWSGRAAVKLGLVDELGGFGDAVKHVRKAAEISVTDEVRFVHWPKRDLSLLGQLAGVSAPASKALFDRLPEAVQSALTSLPRFLWWGDGAVAHLPWMLVP